MFLTCVVVIPGFVFKFPRKWRYREVEGSSLSPFHDNFCWLRTKKGYEYIVFLAGQGRGQDQGQGQDQDRLLLQRAALPHYLVLILTLAGPQICYDLTCYNLV